mmetsp:Transcript_8889/g.26637  ORF Transcript_8889/g.26637 Transcript_8889/m.26637 type:complete len:327 (-) Transcript_8889:48-1028(-)
MGNCIGGQSATADTQIPEAGIGPVIDAADSFRPDFSTMISDKEINLARRAMRASDMLDLADRLRHDALSVEKLNLYACSVTASGVAEISDALRTNSSLLVINLGGNAQLGDDGAAVLAAALRENTTLRELHLFDCCISSFGATSLADALLCNSSIRKINLNNNLVGDSGAEALAQALIENTSCSLKSLKLRFNVVGARGAVALVGVLKHPLRFFCLDDLDLGYNKISIGDANILADALELNCTVTSFDLRGNGLVWDEQAVRAKILKSIKKNRGEVLLQMCTKIDCQPSFYPFTILKTADICGLQGIYRLVRERPDIVELLGNSNN